MSESDNSSQSDSVLFTAELCLWLSYDDISEEGLRQIIRRHKSATNNLHVSDYELFHAACRKETVTAGIIRCLLEYFPAAVNVADEYGRLPLHYACENKHVSLGIIKFLIDTAPDSVRHEDSKGCLPLHILCCIEKLDEAAALQILKLLLKKYPDSIRHKSNDGFLPIHFAAKTKSPEFCRVLIEAYPGSERNSSNNGGLLPFYYACTENTVDIVEYLYNVYPDAIQHSPADLYPIHAAICSVLNREANPEAAIDIVKFLLDCDPRVKLQKSGGTLAVLVQACLLDYNDSSLAAALEMIKAIYDAHPEAIEDDANIVSIFQYGLPQVQTFIEGQLVYSRQAKDEHVMNTPDDNGQLPLHTALESNVRLGSIKLLVKGNPGAVRYPDNSGALPLHIACMHHESTRVVQYLIGLDPSTLEAVDYENNTALHYACRGAQYETIALLLGKFDAVSVSRRNAQEKLPIEILWKSNEIVDRERIEYMESIFLLLKAYPETVMNVGTEVQSGLAGCSGQIGNGKKRKFGNW